MSGDVYTIKPGSPQQLTGAPVANGASIVNMDSVNGVWLGSDQSVSPGNGQFLANLANLDWSGKQLWACVDSGVVAGVNINVSSDATNVTNPVAIGAAIAAILLAQGVPSVAINTAVAVNQTIAPGATITFPIGSYASLILAFRVPSPGPGVQASMSVFTAVQTGPTTFVELDSYELFSLSGTVAYQLPSNGDIISLTNDTGQTLTYTLIGTNRSVPYLALLRARYPRYFAITAQTLTANVAHLIPPNDPVSLTNYGLFVNGTAWLDINCSTVGQLLFQYADASGTVQGWTTPLIVGQQRLNVAFPLGGVQLYYQPNSSAAGQFITVFVVPTTVV